MKGLSGTGQLTESARTSNSWTSDVYTFLHKATLLYLQDTSGAWLSPTTGKNRAFLRFFRYQLYSSRRVQGAYALAYGVGLAVLALE
jgi:hypothetical protein